MNKQKKYGIIILAAGFSSRMGDFKALLKFGNKSSISMVIDSAKLANIKDVIVVTGHRAGDLREILKDKSVKEVFNENYEKGMFSSIQAGVTALDSDTDGFFILPVDYPLIPSIVLMELMTHFNENSEAFYVPCFKGKKGHPPLFPKKIVEEIIRSNGNEGLKSITRAHEDEMIKIDFNIESVVMDMDNQNDYQELRDYYEESQAPNEKVCFEILEKYQTPSRVQEHSKKVSRLGGKIAKALNEKGFDLDEKLIISAGLLHDVDRKNPKHWIGGARIANQYGFYTMATLIENHMFYTKKGNVLPITELDILCFSDKMFSGDLFSTLNERQKLILERFKNDPIAIEAINQRFKKAFELKKIIEKTIKKTIVDLWKEPDEIALKKDAKKIILIRHGETKQHKEKIFLGQTDLPLSSKGREDAKKAGDELSKMLLKLNKIYTSDLIRAQETTDIICDVLKCSGNEKIEQIKVPEFREMNLGLWDGLYINEVKERFPEDYIKRGKNIVAYKIRNHGENYYDLRYRVMKKLKKILEEEKNTDIFIVAHAGVIASMRSVLEGLVLEKAITNKIKHGEIYVIQL
jgi:CTP:molybdopterin cytidylyltransferase MocA/broad specificity phosphatase PhoE